MSLAKLPSFATATQPLARSNNSPTALTSKLHPSVSMKQPPISETLLVITAGTTQDANARPRAKKARANSSRNHIVGTLCTGSTDSVRQSRTLAEIVPRWLLRETITSRCSMFTNRLPASLDTLESAKHGMENMSNVRRNT